MPESKKRNQAAYTPPAVKGEKAPAKFDSPRWVPIAMTTCFVIGLLWIVVWYMAPSNPVQEPLGSWNVAIGFALIMAGFAFATRWR